MKPEHLQKSLWIWVPAVVAFGMDWLTKIFALRHLAETGNVVIILPGCLDLRYAFNEGAAFSMLHGRFYLLTFLSLGALIFLIWWVYTSPAKSRWLWASFGIIIGGALGNLIDRIVRGGVVDFIDAYWRKYHWPTFNVADSCICVGLGIIIYLTAVCKIDQPPQAEAPKESH